MIYLPFIFQEIILLVTSRLATTPRTYQNVYAMRLYHPLTGETHWLHQDTTMSEVNIILV